MPTVIARKQAGVKRTFGRMARNGYLVDATLKMGASAGTYDVALDAVTATYAHTVPLQGLRYQATEGTGQTLSNQADGPTNTLTATRELLLIQGTDLPDGAEPAERDVAQIGDDVWDIVQVASDPLELTFTLSIRRA